VTAEHLTYRLTMSFLLVFYSGLPGLWIAHMIRRKNTPLFHAIRNYQLTRHATFYNFLGIGLFVYCIKNTFFKRFNTKISITKRPRVDEISKLLDELTISELCHILGFLFVLIFQIVTTVVYRWYDVFLYLTIFNTILNLYPVLLQERNKLRLKALSHTLQRQ